MTTKNEGTQRDELAAIYVSTLDHGHGMIGRPEQGERAADAILGAGYRKVRIIETADELKTLNRGTVLASPSWADAFSYVGGEGSPTKLLNVATGAHTSIAELVGYPFFPAFVVYECRWGK